MKGTADKQLYSILAIGILLIIISHWIPGENIINILPNGVAGVSILFVLSGYVVTKLLLEKRLAADAAHSHKLKIIKNFYLQLSLRILPIYYITLFLLLIFYSTPDVSRSAYFYFFSFTSNFYFYKIGTWAGIFSHLWILAAAVQFFLIWPWIILFTAKKYLWHVILGFVISGVIFQIALATTKLGNLLPFACFDSFALGALLAWTLVQKMEYKKIFTGVSVCALVALPLIVVKQLNPTLVYLPMRALLSIVVLWVIFYISYEQNNIVSFILNNKFLAFTGKTGYGLFLYHNFLPPFTWNFLQGINRHFPGITSYTGYLIFFENFIILILLSFLSWIIIEQPFLRLHKIIIAGKHGANAIGTTELR